MEGVVEGVDFARGDEDLSGDLGRRGDGADYDECLGHVCGEI